ncbi:DUF4055 domain-containing protein [Pseudooceanicola sp. C21-150M6]|uniref:DUF4055 domain-containing protein n=1 Tax=Pseudooceanicola sp. C21-150M6 TaxID=3434355 RepID=UPI003D7F9403
MSVETRHPKYTTARIADWQLCADAYQGEGAVKQAGETYLPKPSGYSTAGGHSDNGEAAYRAYKDRAQFPEIMAITAGAMVGIVHQREITIELPDAMTFLHENADGDRTTLVDFHKEITRNLLISGRYGVLADAPEGGGDPYLAGYSGASVINWDRDFYVLDESGMVRDGFNWTHQSRYRVLSMADGAYTQTIYQDGAENDVTPGALGGGSLSRVPFTVASAKDIGPDIETPPLVGVARASKAIYQLSADWRLQLYMSGQETLVAINGDAPKAVGAGVVHEMHGSEQMQPDLKYVSPTCAGIEAHQSAMETNKETAVQSGARLFEQSQQAQESGNARKMRFQSETANLMTVAQVSCSLLERGLRGIAMMLGLNEAEVIVKPPADLLDPTMDAAEVSALWAIVVDGGMSWETFYERLQKGGVMSPERDAEQEYALISGREFAGADSL